MCVYIYTHNTHTYTYCHIHDGMLSRHFFLYSITSQRSVILPTSWSLLKAGHGFLTYWGNLFCFLYLSQMSETEDMEPTPRRKECGK